MSSSQPRTRQIHGKFALHPAGPKSKQRHTIGEAYGFAHVVGHKNNSAPGLRPDALQFVVQQVAGLSIERGEGLIHQQDIGLGGQGSG